MKEDLSESRILIVDDVRANVDVLVGALREDYKLSVALSGESALRSAEKATPDLVLLDIMMPGLDGYDTIRLIRSIPRFRDLPIIAVTARAMHGDREKCLEAGASDYIAKPVDAGILLDMLQSWCGT